MVLPPSIWLKKPMKRREPILQDPADLRLEEDDEGQHAHLDHAAHQIVDAVELQHIGQQQRREEHEQALEQAGSPGGAHQGQNFIQDEHQDGDVQNVGDLYGQQIPPNADRQLCQFRRQLREGDRGSHVDVIIPFRP